MKVLVIGAGTMGTSIAQVCAQSGCQVALVDISEEQLEKARGKITWSLEKLFEKGRVSEKPEEVLGRITFSTDVASAGEGVEVAVEAVVEETEVKRRVFRELERACPPGALLATNTSTIPISEIAAALGEKGRLVGIHFFNPPTLIKAVEVIRGKETSDKAFRQACEFSRKIGMEVIPVEKEVPGFIVNRINLRYFLEALRLVEEGVKPEEVDAAARYRLGMPMGPCEVMDFSGLDVLLAVFREMRGRGISVSFPSFLEEMVREGKTGMKAGEGFYRYSGKYGRATVPKEGMYRVNPVRLLAPAVNEACWLIRESVADRDTIDRAMRFTMNYPKGLLLYADEYGLDSILGILEERKRETGLEEYEPEPLLREMVDAGKMGKKGGGGFYSWTYEKVEFGPVIYEKRHDHAFLTLNRPDKLNALNEDMWTGLDRALRKAEGDPEVRAVVVTGRGRAFCAGDDIAVMGSWENFSEGRYFFEKIAGPLLETLMELEKPVISLVNGYAFGGGFELNLLFDIVVASERSEFSVPEGLIGAFPPIASTVGLALLGKRMIRYCLTCERMSPREASELGLVDLVVPHDQLEAVGGEFVAKISASSPLSIRAVKRAQGAVKNIIASALRAGVHEIIELIPTEDFREGMRAFVEKRKPRWKGK